MRILVFTNSFFPRKSGIAEYVLNLSTLLNKKGHSVQIITYDTEKTGVYFENLNGIKITRLRCFKLWGYFFPYPSDWKKLKIKLKDTKMGVVLTNTRFFTISYLGQKFAKRNKISLIHIEHGSSFVQTKNPIVWLGSRGYDYTFGKKVLKNADKIISISEASKRFLGKLIKKEVEVIPNGISLKNLPKYEIKKEIKNIIYVGRLIYAKGVQDLIQAFSRLDDKNLRLTLVGDGSYRKDLEKLTEKFNLQNKIIFVGEKNKNEVVKLLAKSDLFVNPSYSEGLPTSVLEAGTIGLPVIATDVGGTREVIINNKTGILTKEKDPKQLKEAIEFVINNPEKKIIYATNLKKLIKTKFNWEKIIEKWEKQIQLTNI